MLGLNNLASSKIMIGLLNRLSRAHGKAQMWRQLKKKMVCLNDDRIQNQENKNKMFIEKNEDVKKKASCKQK